MNLRRSRLLATAIVCAVLAGAGIPQAGASRSRPVYAVETGIVIERRSEGPGFVLVVSVQEGFKLVPVTEDQYERHPPLSRICISFERDKLRGQPARPLPIVAVK